MSSSSFAVLFAQVSNAAASAPAAGDAAAAPAAQGGSFPLILYIGVFVAMIYFALIRPQSQAKKKQEETIKGTKTGDKIVTSSGIHGVITNVKESTVIVRVADNVKLEIEKSHIDKITRPDGDSEKTVTAKVS
jgi:preprotein translocase subunit YajC